MIDVAVDREPLPAQRLWAAGRAAEMWRLAGGLVIAKAGVLLVVFLAVKLLPFWVEQYRANFVDPDYANAGPVQWAFSAWDGQHYLYLADHGYHAGQMSNAFYPLFPGLIHLATPLFGSSLPAGLLVSNVCSLAGLLLLFDLFRLLHGGATARRALLLYVAFPTAFFLSLIYNDSLFILLAALVFNLLYRGKLEWAALPAALLPLTKPQGTLVIVPFLIYYWFEHREGWGWRALLPFSPLLGIGVLLAFMYVTTGNPLEMLAAQQLFPSGYSALLIVHPVQLIQQLTAGRLALYGYTNSILDRIFFGFFMLLLIPLFRYVRPSLAVFGLLTGILSVVTGTFMSYQRYMLLTFPIFLGLAIGLRRWRLGWLQWPLLFALIMVQGLFTAMYALDYWVA
ncbi:MAG: glycosyltransferase family 39 protein [Chloroflexi bacterium]|nr:glycosyltransferase family 39 protein [Chloroflexota bacterium]